MTAVQASRTALTVLALAAAGCAPPTGTAPPADASAVPAAIAATPASATPASAAPAASAVASATAAPTASAAAPAASPAPAASGPSQASPTPDAGAPVTSRGLVLAGGVYDEQGAAVDGATITIRSLNAAMPYEASTKTASGSWVVNGAPEGVNLEILATRPGWTTRRRVGSFQADVDAGNALDFGASGGRTGPGAAYFLSDRPEVVQARPATGEGVDPAMLAFELTLSEPLSPEGRKRFEDALRVFPANDAASPDAAATDLTEVADAGAVAVDDDYDYTIKEGTLFLDDPATPATITWDEAKLVAKIELKAPLITGDDDAGKYQVGLVSGGAAGQEIEDVGGEPLGTDGDGDLGAYPAEGDLIRNVFKKGELALGVDDTTAAARWNATHGSVKTFEVQPDETPPVLEKVKVNVIGNDTRLELTFSEPMAAHRGTAGRLDAALRSLANFTFAVAETADDLDLDLDGDDDVLEVDPGAEATFGDAEAEREVEFRLADEDGTINNGQTEVGDIAVGVLPRNAKVVIITIEGRTDWFDAGLDAIKARAEGFGDPAGNAITGASSDEHQPIGSL